MAYFAVPEMEAWLKNSCLEAVRMPYDIFLNPKKYSHLDDALLSVCHVFHLEWRLNFEKKNVLKVRFQCFYWGT